MKFKTILLSIILFFLGLTVYSNSYHGEFVWDDLVLIEKNTKLDSLESLKSVFFEPWGQYFRPMQEVSLAFDTYVWGKNVQGYHISAVVLHSLSAVVLFYLFIAFGLDIYWSLFAAAIFLVHPVNSINVNYISCRGGVLSVFFMLCSFLIYIRSVRSFNKVNLKYLLLSAFMYLFALFSKEDALIFPALLYAYNYFCLEHKFKFYDFKLWRSLLLHSFALVFYIAFRLFFVAASVKTVSAQDMLDRVPGFFYAFGEYIRLIFWPTNLRMSYGSDLYYWNNGHVIVGLIVFALYFCLLYLNRKKKRNIFFLVWPLITLLPGTNIFYPMAFFMGEHLLYFPAIAWFFMLSLCFRSLLNRINKYVLLSLVLTVVVTLSALTYKQNNYWRYELQFYEEQLEKQVDLRVVSLMTIKHIKMRNYDKAEILAKSAYDIVPNEISIARSYIFTLIYQQKYDLALEVIGKAMVVHPDEFKLYVDKLLIEKATDEEAAAQTLLDMEEKFPEDYAEFIKSDFASVELDLI